MARDAWRRMEIDGLEWLVETYRNMDGELRALVKGPHPANVMFTSFKCPTTALGSVNWGMVDTIIARTVDEFIKKYPDRWKKYWGPDGIFANNRKK